MKPEDLFRAEKERAQTDKNSQHARLLAEAKAAFDKLMAEGQAARKSGRPRKHPLPPLKTTSSRPPMKPVVAAPIVKAVAPVAPTPVAKPPVKPVPVKAVASAKPAPAKREARPEVRTAAKRPAAGKRTVKSPAASAHKAKSKAKSSKKR